MISRTMLGAIASVGALWASGGSKPSPPVPAAPNSAEVRVSTEMAPAGGTVQVKYSFTNPQPIMTGGTGVGAYALDGVSLSSPSGDAAGVGVLHDGMLYISAISPSGDLGTLLDYPFLTVTMNLPTTLQAGTAIPLTMSSATAFVSASGPVAVTVKPGTLVVGGTFSINGVTPGGGTYPAGTTVRVNGAGFTPNAVLKTPQMKINSYTVASSTEIDFTLKSQTTLDAQPIQVTVGKDTQTYYSYLRGLPLTRPSRSLLQNTDPIFQQITHAIASVGPLIPAGQEQFIALALQNPNPGPSVATLELSHANGSIDSKMIVMPSGTRIMDDIASLLNVSGISAGDQLRVVATTPIQILGLTVNETTGTVVPFLPVF